MSIKNGKEGLTQRSEVQIAHNRYMQLVQTFFLKKDRSNGKIRPLPVLEIIKLIMIFPLTKSNVLNKQLYKCILCAILQ